MSWLLCDYGQVLSLPQAEAAIAALAEASGLERAAFDEGYWRHRAAYDRGDLSAEAYWGAVLGTQAAGVPLDPSRAAELVELDIASWSRPNEDALSAAVEAAARSRRRLALLSNAPVDIARRLDRTDWLAGFAPRLFSCDLGEIKPEAAVYARALDALGSSADEVVFVDDSQANVDGARAVGIHAHRFEGPETFSAV